EVRIGSGVYDLMLSPVQEQGGRVLGRMFLFHDVTERKEAEDRLRQLSRAVEQSPATIVITDTRGNIEYVNPKFTMLTGYSFEEALGNNPRILKSELNSPEIYPPLWQTILAGNEWRGEFINRKKNGELYYESASISPILDAKGVISHFLAVKEDITERKHAEEQQRLLNQMLQAQLAEIQALQAVLQEQAIRDPLTGLYNRRYLYETMERELARAVREGSPVGFVMIDVDKFKEINDRHGHAAGDLVLQNLADEMKTQTRASDIVCRYGGEEFLVVMLNATLEGATGYAEKLCRTFRDSRVKYGEEEIRATLSIGVAGFPLHGTTSQQVLAAADNAMYQAKGEGRDRVVVWGGK
ncbi:MAG TPA: diguanylate cyclase, partial [Anaerolineaceae bacterium]|nr:diguanylate cyclase [Anaerolineaceae bacterium]